MQPEPLLLGAVRDHLRHHVRFYAAVACGVALGALGSRLALPLRLVIGGDAFFATYLLAMSRFLGRGTPAFLRRRSRYADEGVPLIGLITLAAIGLSLAAIFYLLNTRPAPGPTALSVSFACVILGWLTLHTVAAFHYAHLYYTDADGCDTVTADAGGLAFPGEPEPTAWDFVYYAFVVGMTAQVSDVQVTSRSMRRLTLAHGIVSFFMNTVLVALAVNAAVAIGG